MYLFLGIYINNISKNQYKKLDVSFFEITQYNVSIFITKYTLANKPLTIDSLKAYRLLFYNGSLYYNVFFKNIL